MNIFILEGMEYIHNHISLSFSYVGEKWLSPGKINTVPSFKKNHNKQGVAYLKAYTEFMWINSKPWN